MLAACAPPSPRPTPTNASAGISGRELANVIAFSRLLGYVQFFHPSDQASAINWELFAEQGLVEVGTAQDGAGLASKLNSLFLPIAPTVRIFETDKRPPAIPDELKPVTSSTSLQIVSWRHHGFGGGVAQEIYYSERIRKQVTQGNLPADMPNPSDPFYVDLGGGVSALIPLGLYADEGGTLPHQVVNGESRHLIPISSYSEKVVHLATVVLAWNVFQHFYPYFDVVKTDWLNTLRDTIIAANAAENEEEFINILREMVAQLHDGHGKVQLPLPNLCRPPFGWDWVENQLVITFVEDETNGQLHPGDKVTAIGGQPTAGVLAAQERLISGATSQWIRFSALKSIIEGPYESILALTLQPAVGVTRQAAFQRTVCLSYSEGYLFTERRPSPISELEPGLWYVDLTRVTDSQFRNDLPNLREAVGIIFDLRGYPANVSLEPISHIIDHPVLWPQLNVPVITYPDHQNISYEPIFQSIEPIAPHLAANTVFLTDGRAISYAESYMGIVESNELAEIVGGPTAGTNGNVVVFTLFDKYTFQFTGMQVMKLDGSQHHGIGIQPTVPVTRTIDGVRQGSDELLESAKMVVMKK